MFSRIFNAFAVLLTGKMPGAESELRRAVGFETRRNAQESRGNPPRNYAADKSGVLALLSDSRFRFRSLGALMAGIGSDDTAYVRGLAEMAGARTEYRNPDMYGLKSRVGETGRRCDRPASSAPYGWDTVGNSNPPESESAPPATASNPPDTRETDKSAVLALLSDSRFRFRTIGAMARSIGKDADYVRGLAREVGARREDSNPELFGLVSRVGAGNSDDSDDSDDDDFAGE